MAKKLKYLRVFTILLILAGILLLILKNEAAQFVLLAAGSLLGIYLATKNTFNIENDRSKILKIINFYT